VSIFVSITCFTLTTITTITFTTTATAVLVQYYLFHQALGTIFGKSYDHFMMIKSYNKVIITSYNSHNCNANFRKIL